MNLTATPFLTNKDSQTNTRTAPGMLMHFLATGETTSGSMAVIEAKARKGMEPGLHQHTHEDESFYLLAGKLWFKVGHEEFTAQAGDFVFMPRGVPHQMKLLTETIHALILISPAGFEQYFWQLSQPAEDQNIPPLSHEQPTPKQMEQIMKLDAAYGVISVYD